MQPSLASGDDIKTTCGPLAYTIDLTSAKDPPYVSAFTITKTPDTEFTSGTVSVFTNDQDYALFSGMGTNYRTEYLFQLSAVFSLYSDQITFSHGPVSFWIRDYCAGMEISLPELVPLTDNFNLTMNVFNQELGVADPLVHKLSKYLRTD